MWTKNYRYYSTNPNGACGYILLSYQLQERLPTKLPLSVDLYQPSTRNKFISFLNYQKSHVNTLQFNHHIEKKEEISLRISETIKWVTSSFQSNTNRIPPFLPQSHWFTDTFFPYLKLQNPFTYFNTSPQYTGYLKAMYTSSIPDQHLINTYDQIISFMKDSQVQYDISHFFFLDDPNPTKDLQAFNEAVHNLSSNIYKFFSTTPSAINSTIKHIPTTIDLITPIHTPPLSPQLAAVDMETIVHISSVVSPTGNAQPKINLSSEQLPLEQLSPNKIEPEIIFSGEPLPSDIFLTSLNDPMFQSIRRYLRKVVDNTRRRTINSVAPLNQRCPICQQLFQRLAQHSISSEHSNCYNVVRLRKYICLRKQLPFEVPACLPELQDSTADQLEEYLKDLH